jgi:organic radical activating enzyme
MTSIREVIRRRFASAEPLPSGIYHYQAPPDAEFPYRFHLRLEPDGSGLLIINASTVLHLNQTAAEYAYHLINETTEDAIVRQIAARYHVSKDQAQQDFRDFRDRIYAVVDIPDLDPVTFLEFERDTPYSGQISAPYRLDCALTYHLPEGADPEAAPTKRVDRELTTDEWKTILDKAWDAGIPHVVFTGGEPTLREDLFDLIQHSENLGQVTGLFSDGLKLADPDYLQAFLQTGIDHLMIGFNSDDDRSWLALEKILPEDLYTTIHLTVTPQNTGEIIALIDKLADSGVTSLSLSSSGSELNEVLQEARNRAAELNIALEWDLPVPYSARNPVSLEIEEENEQIPDGAGRAWLYVEPDGDVLPSQGINRVLGNLLRDEWEQIWHPE